MSDGSILEINLNVREVQCSLCREWCEHSQGVPTFNGDLVSNDFPDWLIRQGGGSQPACELCFHAHASGKLRTFDHYYAHLMDAGGECIDGAGI